MSDPTCEAELELLAAVRRWQDAHDVRPSDLVTTLQRIIEIVKPKPKHQ